MCSHENVSLATSSSWQAVCADCGAVVERREDGAMARLKPEDGGKCPCKDCPGLLAFEPVVNCSCHIDPPCSACLDRIFVCEECGWQDGDPIE
jgi:hypothetical protein